MFSRRRAADAVLLVAVLVAAFCYRFNTLGGAFGGFTNDQFGYLARARQIQAGDIPFRDFNDPGWFLTDYLSAAMQWLGGYSLRSEALLTVGMLSLGAALTFVLARRAAGTVVAAVVAVAVHIALDARHYNYPKIVLYATGLALAWAYVDSPSRARLVALGALIGIGFLFRHDHLVYLGALSATTIALVHHASMRDGFRAAAGLCGTVAIFIVPFLIFLALSGGVGEYFRAALVYVTRDAERTSFSLPRLSLDWSKPLVALSRTPVPATVRINVRWHLIAEEARRDGESQFSLAAGEPLDSTTWTYALRDTSSGNIESLVRDPRVDDTHGVDRTNFTVAEAPRWPLRFETQLDTLQNATAFLYYGFLCLPGIAAIVLWRLRRAGGPTHVLSTTGHLVPLLVLAAMLNVGFLSRGSTNIRIADVGVTAVVLLAWLIAALAGRDGHVIAPTCRPPRPSAHGCRGRLVCDDTQHQRSRAGIASPARGRVHARAYGAGHAGAHGVEHARHVSPHVHPRRGATGDPQDRGLRQPLYIADGPAVRAGSASRALLLRRPAICWWSRVAVTVVLQRRRR